MNTGSELNTVFGVAEHESDIYFDIRGTLCHNNVNTLPKMM